MKSRLALSAGFLGVFATAHAAPLCPPVLLAATTAMAPEGFHAFADGNPPLAGKPAQAQFKFAGAMFSEQAPDQSGWLAPDNNNAQDQTWDFRADEDQNIWISCRYAGTSLLLSKPLPASMGHCHVHSADHGASPTVDCQ